MWPDKHSRFPRSGAWSLGNDQGPFRGPIFNVNVRPVLVIYTVVWATKLLNLVIKIKWCRCWLVCNILWFYVSFAATLFSVCSRFRSTSSAPRPRPYSAVFPYLLRFLGQPLIWFTLFGLRIPFYMNGVPLIHFFFIFIQRMNFFFPTLVSLGGKHIIWKNELQYEKTIWIKFHF